MRPTSFAVVFTVNLAFVYLGFKTLPLLQVAMMAMAISFMTMGGLRMLKLR